jgi:hypothetical protein
MLLHRTLSVTDFNMCVTHVQATESKIRSHVRFYVGCLTHVQATESKIRSHVRFYVGCLTHVQAESRRSSASKLIHL